MNMFWRMFQIIGFWDSPFLQRGTRFAQLLLGVFDGAFFCGGFLRLVVKKHIDHLEQRQKEGEFNSPNNILSRYVHRSFRQKSEVVYFWSLEKNNTTKKVYTPAGLQQLGQHSNPNKENHVQASCIKLLTSTLQKLDERWVVKPFGSSANGFSTKERVIGKSKSTASMSRTNNKTNSRRSRRDGRGMLHVCVIFFRYTHNSFSTNSSSYRDL